MKYLGYQPLSFSLRDGRQRKGALLGYADGKIEGWGEASPLPGFSCESIDDILEESINSRTASARFAISCAEASIRAQEAGVPLRRYLNPSAPDTVQVAGLVNLAQGYDPRALGDYPVVKAKVGTLEPLIAAERVRELYEQLGCPLRIDANRAWTADQTRCFAEAVYDVDIQFIEEPTRERALYHSEFPLDLAVDELVQEQPKTLAELGPSVRYVVLKPTLIGSIQELAQICADAQRLDMQPVLSSAFESSIGLRYVTELAAAFQNRSLAAGLDTWSWLNTDGLQIPNPIHGGEIDCSTWDSIRIRPGEVV